MTTSAFQQIIWQHYRELARQLPWRRTHNPYAILVSEIMLQQTQVDRVIPKYEAWLTRWPTFEKLARATTSAVIREWQGLGYNRRALALHRCAQAVVREYAGQLPKTEKELIALPGIGPYTAAAVRAFAYNQPVEMIETNIRTVFLHHYFKGKENVADRELLPLIAKTLDRKNPREWYWALMDYGSYLKKKEKNPSRQSKHYTKQSRFQGSNREVRGGIIKLLTQQRQVSKRQLIKDLSFDPERINKNLQQLEQEGFITTERGIVRLG